VKSVAATIARLGAGAKTVHRCTERKLIAEHAKKFTATNKCTEAATSFGGK